jgi:hypothetical protein
LQSSSTSSLLTFSSRPLLSDRRAVTMQNLGLVEDSTVTRDSAMKLYIEVLFRRNPWRKTVSLTFSFSPLIWPRHSRWTVPSSQWWFEMLWESANLSKREQRKISPGIIASGNIDKKQRAWLR